MLPAKSVSPAKSCGAVELYFPNPAARTNTNYRARTRRVHHSARASAPNSWTAHCFRDNSLDALAANRRVHQMLRRCRAGDVLSWGACTRSEHTPVTRPVVRVCSCGRVGNTTHRATAFRGRHTFCRKHRRTDLWGGSFEESWNRDDKSNGAAG